MITVPLSKRQLAQQQWQHETRSPGTGELHSARCVILEVFDKATLDKMNSDSDIKKTTKRFPNMLYARVRLENGEIYTRPFRDSRSTILLNHGNATIIEGMPGRILFNNARVREGKIVVIDEVNKEPVNVDLAIEVYDIGLLL